MDVTFWVLGPQLCEKCLTLSATGKTTQNLQHIGLGNVEGNEVMNTSWWEWFNGLDPREEKLGKTTPHFAEDRVPDKRGSKGQEAQPMTLPHVLWASETQGWVLALRRENWSGIQIGEAAHLPSFFWCQSVQTDRVLLPCHSPRHTAAG